MPGAFPTNFGGFRPAATSSVAVNSTAANSTAAFTSGTQHARVLAYNGDIFVKVVDAGGAAASSDMLLTSGSSVLLNVSPGQRISGITTSTGTTAVLIATEAT